MTSKDILMSGPHNWTNTIDQWGQQLGPVAFIREYTHNGMQAVARNPQNGYVKGHVVWDKSPVHSAKGTDKLMVADNGCGMTHEVMVDFAKMHTTNFDELGTSLSGNHGVGARGSSLYWNKGEGVFVASWRDGEGYYGIIRYIPGQNSYGWDGGLLKATDKLKKDLVGHLKKVSNGPFIEDHGTVVVFLGNTPDQDTTLAPEGSKYRSEDWIQTLLNQNYAHIPDSIVVKAMETRPDPKKDRKFHSHSTVKGCLHYAEKEAMFQNDKALPDGSVVEYFAFEKDNKFKNARRLSGPFAAIAYTHPEGIVELYSRKDSRALTGFGFARTSKRAIVVVHPPADAFDAQWNRTSEPKIRGDNPPWDIWKMEFCNPLPDDIMKLEASESQDRAKDLDAYVKDTLESFLEFMNPLKLKKASAVEADTRMGVPTKGGGGRGGTGGGGRGGTGGAGVKIYAVEEDATGDPAKQAGGAPNLPEIEIAEGDAVPRELEDRAAMYIHSRGLILINADYGGYDEFAKKCVKKAARTSLSESAAYDAAMDKTLAEAQIAVSKAVVSILGLSRNTTWSYESIHDIALKPQALTAVAENNLDWIPKVVDYILSGNTSAKGARKGKKGGKSKAA